MLENLADEDSTCANLINGLSDGTYEGYLLKPMNCPHHIKIFASDHHSYRDLPVRLADLGVRLTVDRSSDKIGAKIRNSRLDRVPYMLVIGQHEAEEGTVSARHRDKDDLGAKPLDAFFAEITAVIRERSL